MKVKVISVTIIITQIIEKEIIDVVNYVKPSIE